MASAARSVPAPAEDHWRAHARQWSQLGSPLRPHADDVRAMRHLLAEPAGPGLLLGVTPELADVHAPLAVDRDRAMIDALWPRRGRVVQAQWLALPFAAHSFGFALGDGCVNVLPYPEGQRALLTQLRRVLQARAPVVVRLFTAPDIGESCDAVMAAALNGEIGNFHAFKWRLAMALAHEGRQPNVGVAAIYRAFAQQVADRRQLSQYTGWPLRTIATLDVYRDSPAVYSFPTAAQWRALLHAHGEEEAVAFGRYELAERCPIVRLRLRP